MSNKLVCFFLIFFCVLFSISFFTSRGTDDVNVWLDWVQSASTYGYFAGYAYNSGEYPPLTSVLLSLFHDSLSPFLDSFIIVKFILLVFLLITFILFWRLYRSLLMALVLYIGFILSTLGLGYTDILFAPFILLAFHFMQVNKPSLSLLMLTISILIKWQPLFIAPFIIWYIHKKYFYNKKEFLWNAVNIYLFPIGFLLTVLAFFGKEVVASLVRAGSHNLFSGNALNIPWILSYVLELIWPRTFGYLDNSLIHIIKMESTAPLMLGTRIFFLGIYSFIFIQYAKQNSSIKILLFYSLLAYLAYFIFNTGVHENHLFMAVILSAILTTFSKVYLRVFLLWLLLFNVNLFLFYGLTGDGMPFSRIVGTADLSILFVVVIVCGFFYTYYILTKQKGKFVSKSKGN